MKAMKKVAKATTHPEAVITKHRIPVDYDTENVISDVVTLTPAWASDLLTRNSTNRPINRSLVDRIVNDIKGGRWKFNGEPMIIADSEKLLDGQHRCHAVVESGICIKTMLVYGVPEDRFDSIDKGASRSNKDVLGAKRIPYYNHVAAAAAIVYAVETNKITWKFQCEFGILEFIESHPALAASTNYIMSLQNRLTGRALIPPSVPIALHYLMAKSNAPHADQFWRSILTGEELLDGMPEYFIRQKLIARSQTRESGRDDRESKRHIACLCVLAWNKSLKGEQMRRAPVYSISESGFPKVE